MKSICVFGVFVADLCFVADAIPEKGQTILGSKHIVGPGGKGSNQAIAAARLGGKVNFITKIGNDQNANMALNLYKEAGINTDSIIQDENQLTGVAGIMINKKTGDNAINIVPGAAGSLNNKDIDKNISFIENSEIFLTQLETPYEVTSYALQKAKDTGSITIFNPAPAQKLEETFLQHVDWLIPNENEFEVISGLEINDENLIEFKNQITCELIVTLGERVQL